MIDRLMFIFGLLLSLLSSGASESQTGHILLIRHGEKINKARSGDVHLSKRGEIRADALARFFYPKFADGRPTEPWHDFELPRVDSVIAQSATSKYASQRKIETAKPIAEAGGVPLSYYDQEDINGICEHTRKESLNGRTTLVVWDHTTISDVANNLLGLPSGTVKWPMDRYDIIWDLDPHTGTLTQFCQHLLYGDLWCPLNPIQVYPAINGMQSLLNQARQTVPLAQ